MTIRAAGAKLLFLDIEGDSSKIQLMATATNYIGDFDELNHSVKRGDFIGVEG